MIEDVTKLTHWQMTGLAVLAVLSCLVCLWMLFFFSRRLQGVAYLRGYLLDIARKEEFSRLERELKEEALRGPLAADHPQPPEFGPTSQLWENGGGWTYDSINRARDGETPDEKTRREEILKQCRDWATSERRRYAERLKQAAEKAQEMAEERVPRSLDMSLLGGGWSFLLEFSTLIVIIFSILALGMIRVMDGKDIVPILAAIAGYVLGRSGKAPEASGKSASVGSPLGLPVPASQPVSLPAPPQGSVPSQPSGAPLGG